MMYARKLTVGVGLLMGVVLSLALAVPAQSSKPVVVESAAKVEKATQQDRDELASMSAQDTLSPLFRKIVKVVGPSVVEVRVEKRVEQPQVPPELEDFFRHFQSPDQDDQDEDATPAPAPTPAPTRPRTQRRPPTVERGLGSGTIVDAKNGIVLTNWHVVGGATEVKIITADGKSYSTDWVKGDPQSDLAVLKIKNSEGLIDTPLGNSDDMQVGDLVLAIGSPEGLEQTVTMGIISAKGRTTGRGAYESFIQTDAAVNHGNSGGPLVNMKGEIVGVTSAIVSRTGVNEGIGLAVPSNMAKNIMKQLIETGKVVRGFLGVAIQDNTPALAESFHLSISRGAVVTNVLPDSPAKAAGLKEDDVIVEVDGKSVLNSNELRNQIAEVAPGHEVKLGILRGGQKMEITLKVGEQPADMAQGGSAAEKQTQGKKYGLQVQDLSKDIADQFGYDLASKGVVITDVDNDSDAFDKGLRSGMMIDRVNEKAVANVREFLAAVSEAKDKAIRLHVVLPKNGGKRYFVISPK